MGWKEFFKPTKRTVAVFVVLAIAIYLFFANTDTRIFPCQTQPVIPDPPPLKDSVCGLGVYFGASKVLTPAGYFLMFLTLIVIPYLAACGINSLRKHK